MTHVTILSPPHIPVPKMVESCAFHTATGLLVRRDQSTIQPSASPDRSRVLWRKKVRLWMVAECPRRM